MRSDYIKGLRSKIGHMPIILPTVGIIICKDGKVLLQKRQDDNMWAMHGGGMEPGETIKETLYREVSEELNIKPINPKLLGVYAGEDLHHFYSNGDEVYFVTHAFICKEYEGEINFTDHEVLECKWFDLNELPENILPADKQAIYDVKEYLKTGEAMIR